MLGITSQGEGTSKLNSKNIIIATVLLFVGLAFWAWYANPLVVTVTGTGEVTAKPEKATISFILSSTAPDVNDAIGAVGAKQTQIREAIALYGIAEEDMVQSQVTVIPPALLGTGATNYSATVTMSVDISDYSSVNSLVAFLYANGVSYVSQPVLSVADTEKLKEEALELAIKDASSKASKLALKNWRIFKKKVLLSETTSTPSSSSTTKTTTSDQTETTTTGDTFKASSVVSLTYKMW